MVAKTLLRSVLLVYSTVWVAHAQQFENVGALFDGEKVILSYDLLSLHPEDRYAVTIFSSLDNYTSALSLLVGDAGESVAPGKNRKVTWDARSSLPPNFDSTLTFKLKAKMVIGLHHPMRLEVMPLDFKAYKRGGILNAEWRGGIAAEPIVIELVKDGKTVEKVAEVKNNNAFSWAIPKKQKAASAYSIRISKASHPDVTATSSQFRIKTKVSLLVKLLPVVVVGGVVAIIASKPAEETSDLPGPISPDQ